MFYFSIYFAMLVGALCTIVALTAMRRREKHNVGKFGWLLLLLLTPPIGLILFLIFGGKKVSAEHANRETIVLPKPDESDAEVESSIAEIATIRGIPKPSRNNRLNVLTTPKSMHDSLFALIESAERRLFVHTFILIDDDVGNRLIDRLCEKARAGVEVRLMVDGFGSFLFSDDLLDKVSDAGGHVTRFKPLSKFARFAYLNFRNHRKFAIADGNRAFLGGTNFVEYEMTPEPDDDTWIDYGMAIEGTAARQVEAVFVSDWNFTTGEEVKRTTDTVPQVSDSADDRSTLQVIPVGPDGPPEILDDLWLTAINRAKDRVWIVTPYFVPPPMAMRSLAMATRRGVDVRIIYPNESDMGLADYARRDYVVDLDNLGAKLHLLPDRMVHAKLLLIDREVAYAGSANFDLRSFFLNYELVVGIFNQSKVDEIANWIETLTKRCVDGPVKDTLKRKFLGVMTRIFAEEL
ncbi:phospholipase D-like domain-containing protein [Aporhodopirellula aestuarii]|uniref:Phospholipase D-like domain-containing protein n=1 Tax=Aporhodopirellula aestuarii TaxID=2950107 RepID=A0ABT0UC74_9BACT|nr:phospholipase D-like domain-containing protein [Aporhodopirellula aestuarii]MCM2374375.1 phospholipase D-like domain-containing protein [Aporhodopirellula aestuarii]